MKFDETANFSVERIAAGGAFLQVLALGVRRHRSPRRSAAPCRQYRTAIEYARCIK